MKKYDTVIFDMDGTVLDTLADLTDATNYALAQMDMPERTIEEVRQFVGNGVKRLMELAVPENTSAADFDKTFEIFKQYYQAHCNDKTCAYEGILDLLQDLKEVGCALAIVSNKLDAAVKELSQIYFNGIVTVAIGEKEGISKKPAPDTVFAALKELGKPLEGAVYVGDSEVDIATAKNSGLPCISVLWGFRDKEFLLQHCDREMQQKLQFAKTPAEVKSLIIQKQ